MISLTDNPLADVVLCCGRMFLRIAGFYVAMEGDVCRDPSFPRRELTGIAWTSDDLKEVAEAINATAGYITKDAKIHVRTIGPEDAVGKAVANVLKWYDDLNEWVDRLQRQNRELAMRLKALEENGEPDR